MGQQALDHAAVVERLRELQRRVRAAVVASHRSSADRAAVSRSSSADTIYAIDAVVDPIIEAYCEEWAKELPMVVIAEGLEPETGVVFPHGAREEDCAVRLIIDPIDGTRGLMYDKRAAWALAGVAPNKGPGTRLRDIEVAVMTELPTSKMGWSDVLWAIKGQGARGEREAIQDEGGRMKDDQEGSEAAGSSVVSQPLALRPSKATDLAHGFATVSNFFPGTKVLASELMEEIVRTQLGPADVTKAMVFDDQYISTGGQFYELIVGHDRFSADLRPIFYAMQGQPEGLCCHPYDCCTMLIAEEAGVILTDGVGNPLDGPMDTTSGMSWTGFANRALYDKVQPVVVRFLKGRGGGR